MRHADTTFSSIISGRLMHDLASLGLCSGGIPRPPRCGIEDTPQRDEGRCDPD